MVPSVALPFSMLSTLQVTSVVVDPVTVAVNCCVWVVAATAASCGETVTVTLGGGGTVCETLPPQLVRPTIPAVARIQPNQVQLKEVQVNQVQPNRTQRKRNPNAIATTPLRRCRSGPRSQPESKMADKACPERSRRECPPYTINEGRPIMNPPHAGENKFMRKLQLLIPFSGHLGQSNRLHRNR